MRNPTSNAALRETQRTKFLETASRIVEQDGLAGVQARRVAGDTHLSVGTLYNAFRGGLDELIIKLNNETLEKLGDVLAQTLAAEPQGGFDKRLMALALAYLKFATDNPKRWRAMFEHRMSEGSPVPDWYRANQDKVFALVAEVLSEVCIDPQARSRAAQTLFSGVHGVVSLGLDRKIGEIDAAELEARVRQHIVWVCDGLAAGAKRLGGAGGS